MGLMSPVVGQRFEFYAAPMLWFGLGWLLLTLLRLVQTAIDSNSHNTKGAQSNGCLRAYFPVFTGAFAIMLIAFPFLMNFNTIKGIVPFRAAYSPEIAHGFTQLKTLDKGRDGVIATWWDYGYFAHFITDLPTLHDPGGNVVPALI